TGKILVSMGNSLKKMTKLDAIYLVVSGLGNFSDNDFNALLAGLGCVEDLKEIRLEVSRTEIGNDSFEGFSRYFYKLSKLEHLEFDLSYCKKIGSGFVRTFTEEFIRMRPFYKVF